ncbi:DUF1883 domain-containing protein [Streptomyces chartreusis]|uniref:DUF1883 domain-containing protein n=1 Tax=Streptomyces chartreusis TaxID=1969 RepID=UPI0036483661
MQRGQVVVVTLDQGANVRLITPPNLRAHSGRKHQFRGGFVTRSPHRIVVPSTGHWYLTIDLQGLRATSVRHSVRVENAPLCPGPLRNLPAALRHPARPASRLHRRERADMGRLPLARQRGQGGRRPPPRRGPRTAGS